jgi:hypothetical protein
MTAVPGPGRVRAPNAFIDCARLVDDFRYIVKRKNAPPAGVSPNLLWEQQDRRAAAWQSLIGA